MSRECKKEAEAPLTRWRRSRIGRRASGLRRSGRGTVFGAVVQEREAGTARCRIAGRWVTNFGIASAFGLDARPECLARAADHMHQFGVCSSVSRVYQYAEPCAELEQMIARAVGTPDAVVLRSTTDVHCGVLASLVRWSKCVIAVDERAHNTMHRATDICASRGSIVKQCAHNSIRDAETILCSREDLFPIVMIDSVYSMTGDFAPLRDMHNMVARLGGVLYVDDAHGTGIYGECGGGYISACFREIPSDVLVIGSLSKALSGYGGFIAGSNDMREFIESTSEGFLFNGPVPAPMLGVDIEIFRVLLSEEYPKLQRLLQAKQRAVRAAVTNGGYTVVTPDSHIVSIPLSEDAAGHLAEELFERGVLVNLALFPAVPRGQGIVRLTPSLLHTEEDINRLADALKDA